MIVIGPAIIVSSLGTGYYYGALLGLALELWGMWETPEIHPYLKLIINWKGRKQVTQIKDSPVTDSNVVGNVQAEGDVHIYQAPKFVQSEPLKEVSLETPAPPIVDETPLLKGKGEISYNVTFQKGSAYLIEVNSDEPVSVELISSTEWIRWSENPKYGYTVERSRDYVKNANIHFEPRRSGDWVVYIRNESRVEQQVGIRVTEEM